MYTNKAIILLTTGRASKNIIMITESAHLVKLLIFCRLNSNMNFKKIILLEVFHLVVLYKINQLFVEELMKTVMICKIQYFLDKTKHIPYYLYRLTVEQFLMHPFSNQHACLTSLGTCIKDF